MYARNSAALLIKVTLLLTSGTLFMSATIQSTYVHSRVALHNTATRLAILSIHERQHSSVFNLSRSLLNITLLIHMLTHLTEQAQSCWSVFVRLWSKLWCALLLPALLLDDCLMFFFSISMQFPLATATPFFARWVAIVWESWPCILLIYFYYLRAAHVVTFVSYYYNGSEILDTWLSSLSSTMCLCSSGLPSFDCDSLI